MEKNSRDFFIKIRVNEKEKDLIESKFRNSSSNNKSNFIRTMIFEGVILKFNEKKLQEITWNTSGASANVNKIYEVILPSGKEKICCSFAERK